MPKAWQNYATTSWLINGLIIIFYNQVNPLGFKSSNFEMHLL